MKLLVQRGAPALAVGVALRPAGGTASQHTESIIPKSRFKDIIILESYY